MRKVPFFNYPSLFGDHEENLLKIVRDVGQRGAYIMQKDLTDFERRLADYSGAKYALGVANATDALQMLMMAGGIQQGDEVIFCSHTMVATASAIHFAGGVPVPVEVGSDHLIDCESIRAAITSKTKAILPTQLNGRVANMDCIQEIADQYGLQIYEDSAQALGAKFNGKCAGSFGVGGCISFYPAKILGCLGDGGAILCNDPKVYEYLLLLRDHGRSDNGDVVMWGLNSRLDNMQAAILNYYFDTYEETINRRREIAAIYQEALGNMEELVLPSAPDVDFMHFDVYQNYEIEAEDRDGLQAHMHSRGVGSLVQWGGKAVHQFKDLGFSQQLPYTEKLFGRMLMIPINLSLSDEDVHYVSDVIRSYYR